MIPTEQLAIFRNCLERLLETRLQPYIRKTKRQQQTLSPRKHNLVLCGGVLRIVWTQNMKPWKRVCAGRVICRMDNPKQPSKAMYTDKEWHSVVNEYVPYAETIIKYMSLKLQDITPV